MFQGCSSLEHIDIPGNITSIESNAFLDCTMLSDVIFQEGVNTIGADAFKNCKSIKKIIFPSSISEIRDEAFLNCTGINQVFSQNINPCQLAENAFSGSTYLNATLYVPIGAKPFYETSEGWKDFASIVETDDFENIVNYYSANITVSKGGRVLCNGISVTNTSMATTIKAEEDLNLQIIPDDGCRLVSLKVGDENVTNMVVEGIYTIKKVQTDVNIIATFEEKPTYLTIIVGETERMKLMVKRGENYTWNFNRSGSKVLHVYFNDEDVTSHIDADNNFTTPNIINSSILKVVYDDDYPDGDLNRDKIVNAADIVTIVNIIMGQ